MRTTLTIDPDVAAGLERLRKAERLSFKEAVNNVLRRGLQAGARPAPTQPFRTRSVDHGRPLLPNFDDVHGILAIIEEERMK
ncbi:hypothetical protein BH20VER2_BH20VER2_18070 [soil metagenome]